MELGTSLESYKLPVNTPKRTGFGPAERKVVYSLQDLQMGDTSGTTETDSDTDKGDLGYSLINQKGGYKKGSKY